jgi:hypothetical protein
MSRTKYCMPSDCRWRGARFAVFKRIVSWIGSLRRRAPKRHQNLNPVCLDRRPARISGQSQCQRGRSRPRCNRYIRPLGSQGSVMREPKAVNLCGCSRLSLVFAAKPVVFEGGEPKRRKLNFFKYIVAKTVVRILRTTNYVTISKCFFVGGPAASGGGWELGK